AFKTFLYAHTGQDDILAGSPFANRTRTDTEGLIGPFVNTVVLRTQLSGNPTFRELLKRVREMILGADAHQDLPFEKVVEIIGPARDPSRNPLFQVNFRLVTVPLLSLKLPRLNTTIRFSNAVTSKFDLALELWLNADGFGGYFEYSTDLFEEATITAMASAFEQVLGAVLDQPDTPIDQLVAVEQLGARRRSATQTQKPD